MFEVNTGTGADPSNILFVVGGSTISTLGKEVNWRGTLFSPNGEISVDLNYNPDPINQVLGQKILRDYKNIAANTGDIYGGIYGKSVTFVETSGCAIFNVPFKYSALPTTMPSPQQGGVTTLSSITLSAGTLSPTFNSGTSSYTGTLPEKTTNVNITATATNGYATVSINGSQSTGSNTKSIAVDGNPVNITVSAGGSTQTYTVNLICKEGYATVPAYGSITVTITTGVKLTYFGLWSDSGVNMNGITLTVNNTNLTLNPNNYGDNFDIADSYTLVVTVKNTGGKDRKLRMTYW
jgi:hypothetical protein